MGPSSDCSHSVWSNAALLQWDVRETVIDPRFMGIAKIFLLQGAVDSGLWSLSIVLVMATLISYWYYLRVAWFMWMSDPSSSDSHARVFLPLSMRATLFGIAGVILLLGFFPGAFGFLDFVQSSVDSLTNMAGSVAQMAP